MMTLSVCLSASISLDYTSDLTRFFVHVAYLHGSVLHWWHYDMLPTSPFMDDVVFAHNEPYAGVSV